MVAGSNPSQRTTGSPRVGTDDHITVYFPYRKPYLKDYVDQIRIDNPVYARRAKEFHINLPQAGINPNVKRNLTPHSYQRSWFH